MPLELTQIQLASLLALLLDGRWAVAIERCREAGASLEEAKELLGAMLAKAREEYRASQRAGAWAPASAEQAEGNDASRKSEAGGKPEQQPPLEPPSWLLDAYVEALVHPFTGEGLSAEAKRQAGGLPEALRLEAFCQASDLHNRAYAMAIQVYDGKLSERAILPTLKRELPGFGAASYAKVIELGLRDAR